MTAMLTSALKQHPRDPLSHPLRCVQKVATTTSKNSLHWKINAISIQWKKRFGFHASIVTVGITRAGACVGFL